MRYRRYSLIELVVVTILLILSLGYLVPTLLSVLKSSKSVHCQSSLKQFGHGVAIYTENNYGWLPHEDFGSSAPPYDACWYDVVDPYLVSEPKHLVKQDPDHLDLHSEDIDQLGHSFKFNSRLEGYKGKKTKASPAFRNLSSIPRLSQTVLLFDARVDTRTYRQRPYGMFTSVSSRHKDKANILFSDNHVKSIKAQSSSSKSWSGPGGLIWDPDVPLKDQ